MRPKAITACRWAWSGKTSLAKSTRARPPGQAKSGRGEPVKVRKNQDPDPDARHNPLPAKDTVPLPVQLADHPFHRDRNGNGRSNHPRQEGAPIRIHSASEKRRHPMCHTFLQFPRPSTPPSLPSPRQPPRGVVRATSVSRIHRNFTTCSASSALPVSRASCLTFGHYERMSRVFHYFSGEVVQVGDRVRDVRHLGYVAEVFQPGSGMALSCDCPDGGVLTMSDWDGTQSPRIWTPPDGEFWEDLEFIARRGDTV